MRNVLRLLESISLIVLSALILVTSIFAMRTSLKQEHTKYDRAQLVFDPALFAKREVEENILVDALKQKENLIYDMAEANIFELNAFLTLFSEQSIDVISRMDQKGMAMFAARYHRLHDGGNEYVQFETANQIVADFFDDSLMPDALIGSNELSLVDNYIYLNDDQFTWGQVAILTAFYDNQDGTVTANFDTYHIPGTQVPAKYTNLTNAQAINHPELKFARSGKALLKKESDHYLLRSYTTLVEGYCGYDISWEYDQVSQTLTFQGSGDMTDYSQWGGMPPWHLYAGSIERVELDDRITSIGDYCFYGFQKIDEINFPQGITVIGDSAFYNCSSLKDLILPSSLEQIDDYAFYGCRSLESIEFPDSLQQIWIRAFNECDRLKEVSLPANTDLMDNCVFALCDSLTAIWVDPANPYCANDEYGVLFDKAMETLYQFPCGKEIEYVVPDGVKMIDHYSFQSSKIKSVKLSDSVEKIGILAFSGCKYLTSFCVGSGLKSIQSEAFYGAYELARFEVSDSNLKFTTDEFGALYDASMYTLYQCPKTLFGHLYLPDSVKKIETGAFISCRFLSSIDLNRATQLEEDAFSDCSALTQILIPEETSSIPSRCFSGCDNLKSVTLPSTIKKIDRLAFLDCDNLEELYFKGDCPEMSEEALIVSYEGEQRITVYYLEGTDGWEKIAYFNIPILAWEQ